MGCIYSITNQLNNKKYIGKTEHPNPNKRWQEHIRDKDRYKNRPLYRALNKYGIENFNFEILFSNLFGEELCDKEIETIKYYDTYKNGYNATLGGDGKNYIEEEEIQLMIEDYLNNFSFNSLSKKYGHDKQYISTLLKSRGILVDERNCKYSKYNCKIKMFNENTEYVFDSSNDCINFIIKNKISSYKKDTIRKGLNKALNGSRKTYLKYKFELLKMP